MTVSNILGRDFYQGLDADMATCVPRVNGALFWTTDTLTLYCWSGAAWNEVGTGGGGNVATDAIWDAKGDLAAGTGPNTAAKVTVGTDGKYLKADSGQAAGVSWDTPAGNMATDALWDAKGDLAVGTGANTAAKLTVGADGKVLTAASGEATGLKWAAVVADAGAITYTPAVDADWDSDADPGDVDNALDQLSERVNNLETEEFLRSSLWAASFFNETDESLHIWYSLNSGVSWTDMGISYGDTVRDPSMMYYRGKWWLAHTHNGAPTDVIPVLSSTNIRDWTSIVELDTSAMGGSTYAWSPEWWVDDDDSVHLLIACGGADKQIYETHPTNASWTTWSNLVAITGTNLPVDIIDPYMCKIGGMYYLWYKDDTTTYICLATSTSLLTGYTQIESGDWAGFSADEEGHMLVHISPFLWRIYFNDTLTNGQYYSESTDEFATWTAPAAVSDLSGMSHGTIVRVTDPQAVLSIMSVVELSVSAYNNANISIGDAAWTSLALNSEQFDNGGFHSTSVNNSRLTVPASCAGRYIIVGNAEFAANATGERYARIYKGGTTIVAHIGPVPGNAAIKSRLNIVAPLIYLNAGDYVEFQVYQNSSGALNIDYSTQFSPFFTMHRI